jgi:hypothetical protein
MVQSCGARASTKIRAASFDSISRALTAASQPPRSRRKSPVWKLEPVLADVGESVPAKRLFDVVRRVLLALGAAIANSNALAQYLEMPAKLCRVCLAGVLHRRITFSSEAVPRTPKRFRVHTASRFSPGWSRHRYRGSVIFAGSPPSRATSKAVKFGQVVSKERA